MVLRKYRALAKPGDAELSCCATPRASLDFMPSPVSDQPGLFVRDPYHFSDAMLVVPPALVE